MQAMNPHPIEAVHTARDALQQAASSQRHVIDLNEQDLPAYGSALLATLLELAQLAALLVAQANSIDRGEIADQAIRDHPDEKLDVAVRHMRHLHNVLDSAVTEAASYWKNSQAVADDTAASETTREV